MCWDGKQLLNSDLISKKINDKESKFCKTYCKICFSYFTDFNYCQLIKIWKQKSHMQFYNGFKGSCPAIEQSTK